MAYKQRASIDDLSVIADMEEQLSCGHCFLTEPEAVASHYQFDYAELVFVATRVCQLFRNPPAWARIIVNMEAEHIAGIRRGITIDGSSVQ